MDEERDFKHVRRDIVEIAEKYKDELQELGVEILYDWFCKPEIQMKIMVGPIEGGASRALAEEYGLEVKDYDFTKGKWSEPEDYRPCFSTNVFVEDSKSELEEKIKKLHDIVIHINKGSERLAKESSN